MKNTFDHCMFQSKLKLCIIIKATAIGKMRSNLYSFYTDETSDVTSIEELVIYTTF